MAGEKGIIDLCSLDEEVEDYGDENNYVDKKLEEDTSLSEGDSDWSENDASESDLDYHEHDEAVEQGDDDKESAVNKVTLLLKAGSDLKALKVTDCKAYLRKHGLRLTGTKAVCIERIVEHWRIKDGSGKAIYPRSSFFLNCKGDVCKGDIVLFTQKVHDKYDKMKRSGKILGRRTVAGKVIKESYGTAKQQHTFTIEVLWCEGIQKLLPLYPLLVKGRNLYRLMTLRQPWANEADRIKVLSEKHSRGAVARKVMRERKIKLGYVVKDGRLQKPGNTKKPDQGKTRKTVKVEQPKGHQENLFERYRPDITPNHSQHQENIFERYRPDISPHHSQHQENLFEIYRPYVSPNHSLDILNQNLSHALKNPTQWKKKSSPLRSNTSHLHAPRPYGRHLNIPPSRRPPLSHSHANPSQNQSNQRQSASYNGRPASTARQGNPAFYNERPASNVLQGHQASFKGRPVSNTLEGQPAFNPRAKTSTMPAPHEERYKNHHSHHARSNSGYNHRIRDLDHLSEMTISQRADERRYRESNNTRRQHYR